MCGGAASGGGVIFCGAGVRRSEPRTKNPATAAISNPIIPRLRQSPWAGSLLDGVNVASLGLMAAVTWQLGRAALVDPLTVTLALVSALLLFRFKVNSTWLVLGGAAVGILSRL